VTLARTVAGLGERALIARVESRLGPPPRWVRLGIGDDAALVEPNRRVLDVLTTDVLVEGVHFDRAFVRPRDIGAKALAVNLSDLAAMGATPRLALLSLGLPASLPVESFEELVDGFAAVAATHGVAIVGGNVTRSPGPLFVDVTAIGAVHPRKVLRRSGGRPGEALYVTGQVGGAAAGLVWLRGHTDVPGCAPATPAMEDAVNRYRSPEPRVRFGGLVGRNRAASACIDLSDGLGDAVRQLAEASGTGAALEGDDVPWHEALREGWSDDEGIAAALGGDDYELLFAVPPRRRRAFEALARRSDAPRVTRIGVLTAGKDVVMRRGRETVALPAGYAHFAE
jgi:thiamine-monophosphate kinase